MNKNRRERFAKKIVFSGWIFAVIGAIIFMLFKLQIFGNYDQVPIWIIPFYILGSILMLIGIILGSRGIGEPLDKERLMSLTFGYPCWVAAIVYVGIGVLSKFV